MWNVYSPTNSFSVQLAICFIVLHQLAGVRPCESAPERGLHGIQFIFMLFYFFLWEKLFFLKQESSCSHHPAQSNKQLWYLKSHSLRPKLAQILQKVIISSPGEVEWQRSWRGMVSSGDSDGCRTPLPKMRYRTILTGDIWTIGKFVSLWDLSKALENYPFLLSKYIFFHGMNQSLNQKKEMIKSITLQ